jgi:UDP:flavonoid glycosyltransferase YjiC (YdhE family)
MRALVSAGFGEGHAFPALALSRALAARGHDVVVELEERWRGPVGELGLEFLPGQAYDPFPGASGRSAGPTIVEAARRGAETIRARGIDVVVSDLVAPAAALAAELANVPNATLIPTLHPVQDPGMPPFGLGAGPPRTRAGAGFWRLAAAVSAPIRPGARWLRRVPGLFAEVRAELGLPPAELGRHNLTTYGPISDRLALVATFPQLEPARPRPPHVHVCGPMTFELPEPEVPLPPGDEPLVLVAPSTSHAGSEHLLDVALAALADEPVRVLATHNRRGAAWRGPVPPNAAIHDWVSYAQVMPEAAVVVANGGHGTVARALVAGTPVVVCASGADTAENGARLARAGAGLLVPRVWARPGAVRRAVRRVLRDRRYGERAAELAAWAREHDGAARGAKLVEELAGGRASW